MMESPDLIEEKASKQAIQASLLLSQITKEVDSKKMKQRHE
jgi:hypothetical protein